MSEAKWQYGKPPNEQIIEVEYDGALLRVMAHYGRDGYLPHWRTPDGGRVFDVSAFERWRVFHE